eukprot:COSAG01_NODE_1384_length_10514_cov_17.435046_4_plen_69_part_00
MDRVHDGNAPRLTCCSTHENSEASAHFLLTRFTTSATRLQTTPTAARQNRAPLPRPSFLPMPSAQQPG